MQLCKVRLTNGEIHAAAVESGTARLLTVSLSDVLHAPDPSAKLKASLGSQSFPLDKVRLLAPVDLQEIWAAGVTYKRSREAHERESEGAARFYDLVYTAPRPELFLKATARRVVGPGENVHIRRDAGWSVPEPELTLVLSPVGKIVGYTIGNDMSSRDIEGENPLYLPQAKIYDCSCSIGPVITLVDAMPPRGEIAIRLTIERAGQKAFEGATSVAMMARPLEDLADWLFRETEFPDGVLLLTGTGVVPDDFTLQRGDIVHIDISSIGRLTNPVAARSV